MLLMMHLLLLLQRRRVESHLPHRNHIERREDNSATPIRAPRRARTRRRLRHVDVSRNRAEVRLDAAVFAARRHQVVPAVLEDGVVKRFGDGAADGHEGDSLREGLDDATLLLDHAPRDVEEGTASGFGADLLARDDDKDGMEKNGSDCAERERREKIGAEINVGEISLGGVFLVFCKFDCFILLLLF